MSNLEPLQIVVESPQPEVANTAEIDIGADPTQALEPNQEPSSPADDGIDLLKKQLELKQKEAEEAKRLRYEAERLAQQREQEISTYKNQAQDSQHTAFVNAIASFERDAEKLEIDYANHLERGEFQLAAKVQRQMAQIENKLSYLNDAKETIENQLRAPAPKPEITPMQKDPLEDRISQLSPPSQAWIRSHPEVISDKKLNALMTSAHWEAVAKDIQPDTNEYFSFLENKIWNQPDPVVNEPPARVQTPRTAVASAPVSRTQTANIRPGNTTTITLTPEERATARDMDMTDEEYAANLLYYMNKGDIRTR